MRISDWSSDVCSSDLNPCSWEKSGLFRRHQGNRGIEHAIGETPLVVVPGRGLDQRTRHFGQAGIDRAGSRIVVVVHRHQRLVVVLQDAFERARFSGRSEEHTSELQSLMRISYAVFCLKKKTRKK